jgi:hypothetical protein
MSLEVGIARTLAETPYLKSAYWLILSGSNLNVAHGVGVPSDQMIADL